MSELERLIQQLCPDGVEYKRIGEIATDIYRGSGIKRDEITQEGISCVRYGEIYTTYGIWFDKCVSHTVLENVPSPKYFEHGDILFAITGENVEDIAKSTAYVGNEKCLAGGDIVVMKHNQNPKYLSYALSTVDAIKQKGKGRVKSKVVHSSVPAIKDISIPVPPLEVQCEIVRILDNFTELAAELAAELTARKKQYAHYRDTLLKLDNNVPFYTLKDVCLSIADGDHMPPPKADSGIPFITISNITETRQIDFSNVMYVPREYYDKLADKRKAKQDDILYTVVGSFGIPVHISNKSEFVFQRHIAILRPNQEMIVPRYIYHIMQSTEFYKQADKAAKGAAQRTIGLSSLGNMTIPVPSIEEQKRIVSILDRFDTLCNDISAGLPAEIEARQKQYEYYRDKLLSFKRKEE